MSMFQLEKVVSLPSLFARAQLALYSFRKPHGWQHGIP